MKIIAIYGAMPNYDGELSKVLKMIADTLTELEVEYQSVNLAYAQIPYYDGISASAAEEIMKDIAAADGVIFAATSMLYGVSTVMRAFLEYFLYEEHKGVLRGKNCMSVVCSHTGDEGYALNELSRIINSLGAYDSVTIGVPPAAAKALSADTCEIIERQVEDFYRVVRQNRRFFISGENSAAGARTAAVETASNTDLHTRPEIAAVYEKLNLHSLSSKQEKDIDDIAQLLAKKRAEPAPGVRRPSAVMQLSQAQMQAMPPQAQVTPQIAQVPAPAKRARLKTCKQMTQNLPHYFQPQMAAGFVATIQVNVTGAEKFEGYVEINNADCRYSEGTAAAPDITVISDAAVWTEVLTGKSSAQKAFMIGKLKVRGNFVVLTKLEQLFKPMT